MDKDPLIRRWGDLKTERSSWMQHWQDISNNLLPRSGRFLTSDSNRGGKRHNSIYDNSGTKALRVLAAGMMAGMTSPARPWFRLATPDQNLNKAPAVKQWLADVTRLMLAIYAKSNTYRTLHTGYEELGAFGTWSSVVLDDFKNVIHHYPLTIGEFAIAQNFKGDVVTLYRDFRKTVAECVAEFGKEQCTQAVRNLYDTGKLDAWVPIIHAIEPRQDRDTSRRDAKNMAWKSCYFEAGCDRGQYLREGGHAMFPAMAARWAVAGGDVYGNSPGMDALGDIKQLQHQQLRKGQAIDYQVKPPLQLPSSMKGREVDTLPGGFSYYDGAPGSSAAIRSAFDVHLRLDYLLTDMQDVRERIRGAFSADLFLMLANSTNTTMTATEVAERHEEKMLMLGPVIERLHTELLDPLIEITFARIVQTGLVPPPPPELSGMALNVEFVSMLAQAQRAIATNGVDRFVANLGVIAGIKPDVVDKLDADQWADRYAEMLGVDPEMLVVGDRLVMIRNQRAQAQAQAQQVAMAEQAASAAQKLGTVQTGPQADNAASSVLDAFAGYT